MPLAFMRKWADIPSTARQPRRAVGQMDMAEAVSIQLDSQSPVDGAPGAQTADGAEVPLCVDLDGTLIATDSLWEALLLLAKARPLDLAQAPFWASRGKAHFKQQVAQRVKVDVALLPYRQDVLEFLREQRQSDRRLVLATASHRSVARAVADHLGIFDEIVASDDENLLGEAKLAELEKRFGAGKFDYVGDSASDVCLWKAARRAYVVAPGRKLLGRAAAVCTPHRVFERADVRNAIFKALRPHQWVKNLLLLVPLILAHKLGDGHKVLAGAFAFLAFSLCASAIYILNDLLDLESDRRHPTKRRRPFASGKLSVQTGMALSAGLLAMSFGISLLVPWQFRGLLAVYLVLTTAYSFWLKRKLLVDVILLSVLYTHRIISGAAAVDVPLTMWLLAFSMFFFLSLAFAKRYSELIQVEDSGEEHIKGRGYEVRDLRVIESVGPTSGYLAVLVFCNYLDSPVVRDLYPGGRHLLLWLVAPVLLYWITRVWFIARRRQLHDDPIIFAIRDRRSHICGIVAGLIVLVASMHWKWPT
ncbi:MAG: Decaprenyl-phosphate phosphoribosyltransferase [Phycisphaerales bacterium]|nr:Decaprenyl-phosphate phosphoribosyltransferase [Phycisphaerales bacterium]MDB5354301.1 Decaprenyl-phosphate phosphoribosyltransferase [Phycisphaerales bacterium]